MFIKTNNEISYTASDIEAMSEIPSGNWLLKFNQMRLEYYLESTPPFKFPKKIYGNAEKLANRYLNTFDNSDGNLGVLLTGTKGTGKSVTAKLTASLSKLAVIIITEPFHDDTFKSFLSNIKQKSVVLVDEFEKVYHNHELQNSFLSILDGVFEGDKLFLFTSNEKDNINRYMLNRPGRIHYLVEYDSLEDTVVKDVIDDNLVIVDNKQGLIDVLNILGTVTMDILISLIREMNMYEEDAKEAINYLNLKPESSMYEVEIYQGKNKLGTTTLHEHPLANEKIDFEFMCSYKDKYIDPNVDDNIVEVNDKVCADIPGMSSLSSIASVKETSGWIYLEINIIKSKVTNIGKKIIIESDNNMRYVFSKKSSYYFAF